MLLILPTFPINISAFLIIAGIVCISTHPFIRGINNIVIRWLLSISFGMSASSALMVIITAVEHIPDDWSACRIAVPVSLLFGYPLYPDLNTDPSNAYFYLPVGAWMYLPSAVIGKIFRSATLCLTFGWLTTICAYLTPLVILLYRLKNKPFVNILLFFLALIYSVALPQLRYEATMIHVDSVGIILAGTALVLILPFNNSRSPQASDLNLIVSGILLGMGIFVKQTIWPIIALIILAGLLIYKKRLLAHCCFILITASVFLALTFLTASPRLIKLYCFQASTSVPQGITFIDSLRTYICMSWSFYAILLFLLILLISKAKYTYSLFSVFLLFVISIIITPFSIYTFSRVGADVNHLAWPSYLLLCCVLIVLSFLARDSEKIFIYGLFPIIILGCIIAVPYLNTNCGWYLLRNNPHQCALQYSLKNPGKVYFPWQPLTPLLAENKMYHIDQGLMFEAMLGIKSRSEANINRFMPNAPFKIALRPYSAPSYVVQKDGFVDAPPIQDLPGWRIYQKN